MKVAFLIDKESVFNTYNFIKLINEVARKENISIDFIVSIKKCKFYDFVFSLTDKYNNNPEYKHYNIYPLYLDDDVKEFSLNDLFYGREYYDEYEYEELFYYEKSVISKIIKEFKENNKDYLYASEFLKKAKSRKEDFIFLDGEKKVLLSAPHNVSQYYKGIYKVKDLNTGKLVVNVLEKTKCYGIIKTKNIGNIFKDDNANRQIKCPYRTRIKKMVIDYNIKAIIDLHALRSNRKEQINFGINGGDNLFNDKKCLNDLIQICSSYGFNVSVDKPFKGGYPTISEYANKQLGIYSLQIEINSKYINYIYKASQYNKIVDMIIEICNYLNSLSIK